MYHLISPRPRPDAISAYVEHLAIKFMELDAPEQPIEIVCPNNQSHAGSYRLVLNKGESHRSSGHHEEGGALAEILFGRSATR
jgi:hypothetical protein